MQAITENFKGGDILLGILRKNWRAGKAEYLEVPEEIDDIAMAFSKVTPVALVENHHKLFVPQILNPLVIEILFDGGI